MSESERLNSSIDNFICWSGQANEYQAKDLNELTLAYAVTVYKSQGSEYPCVIMPVTMSHYIMLQRNLVYTGITRGKKLVVIVGEQKAMAIAVNNNKVEVRHSQLAQKLVCTEPQVLLVEAEKSELELGAC